MGAGTPSRPAPAHYPADVAIEVDPLSAESAEGGQRAVQAAGGRLLTARGLRTRAALVAAAKQVFEEIPFPESRITDITARAGVASGTFYTYFDSKEEIFREVAAEVLGEMSAAPRRDPDNVDGDLIRDIEYASRQYFLVCVRNPGIVRSIEQVAPGDKAVMAARRPVEVGAVLVSSHVGWRPTPLLAVLFPQHSLVSHDRDHVDGRVIRGNGAQVHSRRHLHAQGVLEGGRKPGTCHGADPTGAPKSAVRPRARRWRRVG